MARAEWNKQTRRCKAGGGNERLGGHRPRKAQMGCDAGLTCELDLDEWCVELGSLGVGQQASRQGSLASFRGMVRRALGRWSDWLGAVEVGGPATVRTGKSALGTKVGFGILQLII